MLYHLARRAGDGAERTAYPNPGVDVAGWGSHVLRLAWGLS